MAEGAQLSKTPDYLSEEEQNAAANKLAQEKNQNFADGPNFNETVSSLNDGSNLGHGDLTGISQTILSPEEQRKAATKLEQARLERENSNYKADNMNNALRGTGVGTVMALKNRKKIRQMQGRIATQEKEKNETNKKLQAIAKKKKVEQRQLEAKLLAQEIRIAIETVSGIGIPAAIWEAIKLVFKNKEIGRLKKDQKKIKTKIAQNEENYIRANKRLQVEIYNLQNIFKREAEPES